MTPISFKDACAFVAKMHRHHKPPVGWKFGVAVESDKQIVGVVIVGRPVARRNDDGHTLEVTRCCTDGTKNACSILYAAAARGAKAMGYSRIITYTLESEDGASLRASGWKFVRINRGGSWSVPSRRRVDKSPTCRKKLWEKQLKMKEESDEPQD